MSSLLLHLSLLKSVLCMQGLLIELLTNLLKAGLLFSIAAAPGRPCSWRASWPYSMSIRAQRVAAGAGSSSWSPYVLRKYAADTDAPLLSMFLAAIISETSVHRLVNMPFRSVMFLGLMVKLAVQPAKSSLLQIFLKEKPPSRRIEPPRTWRMLSRILPLDLTWANSTERGELLGASST